MNFLLLLTALNWSNVTITPAHAQVKTNEVISTDKTVYRSSIDSDLTIRKVSVLPILDNVGGIYSRPLEQHLIDVVNKDHQWDYIQLNLVGPLVTPEELSSDPQKVGQLVSGLETDAVISTRITKGPNGITLIASLFLTSDNKLFAEASIKNFKRFEVSELKEKMTDLVKQLKSKIPYEGLILSRQGNRVTVNLGQRDGMEEGKVISVVQIIKTNRHPKFNFIINADKEVLGKIRLLKIDDTLSFGKIVVEKEKGAIQRDAKLSGIDFVKYADSETLSDNTTTQDDLLQRPDGILSFGRNAVAWLPKKPPTFGMIGATLGNSLYTYNMQQTEGLAANSVFNPYIGLNMELWVTPTWTMHAGLRQGILGIDNPKSGSSPSDLSASMSFYEFLVGYKFRLSPTVWGPQVELMGGMANYDLKVDDSAPRGLTSTKYSGLKLGLSASYPFDAKKEWSLGTNLFFFFNPKVSENPVSSGSGAESSINQFGVFVSRKMAMNLRSVFNLDFELFKTNFNAGSTATSSSQKYTSLSYALQYMF